MKEKEWKKRMIAVMLAFVLAISMVTVQGGNDFFTVEAATKKDKKKPVIKMSGKSKNSTTRHIY